MENSEKCIQDSVDSLGAIEPVENAVTTYKNAIMTLINTNAQLCKEITEVHTNLESSIEKIVNIKEAQVIRSRHY